MKKDTAIIIVNWNGKHFLDSCFKSIEKQIYKNFIVYLVDNGSEDGSVKFVEDNFPSVKIIKLKMNYGFAGGNNYGIKSALKNKNIKYIVCLNNDTIVDKNWLGELIKSTRKSKDIGAVGSKILFMDDKSIINSLGIIPLKNGNALNYGKNLKSANFTKSERIFGPCAGSALYTRKCLEKVGLFDKKYFCYLEDVDLAWRINLAGYKCILNPKSYLYHVHSGTSKKFNSFKNFLILRNSMYNLIKYLKIVDFILYPFVTLLIYRKIRKINRISREIEKTSKFLFLVIMLKAYVFSFIRFPTLLRQRREICRKQEILDKEKINLFKEFYIH